MKRSVAWLGSLPIAVTLLVLIAAVLAWGTIYEARFGTASVQRYVYAAWWFQALLGFLAANLATAAIERYPWKRQHLPFLLAHIGIILILLGGIIGSRFGIEGQLIIPEGEANKTLETPGNVIILHDSKTDARASVPTRFETQAWVHSPDFNVPVQLGKRQISLKVDSYFPDAVVKEQVVPSGDQENPAVHVLLSHGEETEDVWLFANDPQRFGVGWASAHLLFLAPETDEQLAQLTGKATTDGNSRGVVTLKLPKMRQVASIPVPEQLGVEQKIPGTAYRITFKDYFPDFVMNEQGLGTRSNESNNPAVSFILSGPEGKDGYLLFALHPDFQSMHGFKHAIPAEVRYVHTGAGGSLPPNAIALIRSKQQELLLVMTDEAGKRLLVSPVALNQPATHPALDYQVNVDAYYPKAQLVQDIKNRGDEVHSEALHIKVSEAGEQAEGWVMLRGELPLNLAQGLVNVEFRPAQRELPMTIKLLDFRKTDYPGIQMAATFESDVELTDPQRGVILMKKIYMNHPLRYRGFSFFQSSYVPGEKETTVLSVKNDPGTPFVYAGFIIVIGGVVSMFVLRRQATKKAASPRKKKAPTASKKKAAEVMAV